MSILKRSSTQLILVLGLLIALLGLASADQPELVTSPYPPQPPLGTIQEESAPARPGILALSGLKAVLIVGPIDGDYGTWTTNEKRNMDLAATELAANGVEVHKFYAPNNNWGQIKTAANGAHFLMYRGHGVYVSGSNPLQVGGFFLSGGVFKSSSDIRNDLKLARNAIVMLYGCFTAGSSSLDKSDIGLTEARRRIMMYSDPFFDNSAAGYYANWFGNAFQLFVRYLFQGQTLGQAYQSFNSCCNKSLVDYGANTEHPPNVLWAGKNNWRGYYEYNNAFSGLADKTLADLFGMIVDPQARVHLAEPTYPPYTYQVTVESNTGTSFGWTATIEPAASWMTAYPLTGTSGQSITVVITPTGMATGAYETGIRIVPDNPMLSGRISSVKLIVADHIHGVYLPVVSAP